MADYPVAPCGCSLEYDGEVVGDPPRMVGYTTIVRCPDPTHQDLEADEIEEMMSA